MVRTARLFGIVGVCTGLTLAAASWAQPDAGKPAAPKDPPARSAQPAAPPADKGNGNDARKGAEGGAMGMSPDEQKAFQEAMTPGKPHEWLARMVGSWTCDTKLMMPGQPVHESKGTVTVRMEMGGRFQRGQLSADMMGMPFHGEFTCGYNNVTGEYESVWMDDMSTSMATAKGKMQGDTLVMYGEFTDPVDRKAYKVRETLRYTDNDTLEQHFYETRDGQPERESMSIIYRRVKQTSGGGAGDGNHPAPAKPGAVRPASGGPGSGGTPPKPGDKR